ncbi:flagellar basal body-associated FliL family protein [Wansuia hejianensis]|uniref:Flagellar protein FliL n=1 Tax=Wansuia hejianensis TaxID=2763667 RepID=A0A926IH55_9FIRM|nr:flagellar basal body-associated FliL family protein [Wansuia hejianensis]
METKDTNNKFRVITIALLVLILALIAVIGFLLLPKNQSFDMGKLFEKENEHTLLLDEFVVNLRSEKGSRHYLKVEISLMFTKDGQAKVLEESKDKVRDVILKKLREKSYEELIDVDYTNELKEELENAINVTLKDEIVKEVYFTNLVIQ